MNTGTARNVIPFPKCIETPSTPQEGRRGKLARWMALYFPVVGAMMTTRCSECGSKLAIINDYRAICQDCKMKQFL